MLRITLGILLVTFIFAVLGTLGLSLMQSTIMAATPDFSRTPTITKNSDHSFTVNYKMNDLGKRTTNITATSQSTMLVGCVNPGGNLSPSKGSIIEQEQSESVKIKPKDGKIQGTLTLGPPSLPSGEDICPNKNWSPSLLSLEYTNIVLDATQKGSEILKFNFKNIAK